VFFVPLQQIAKILGFGPASKVSEKKYQEVLYVPNKKIQETIFGVGGCLMDFTPCIQKIWFIIAIFGWGKIFSCLSKLSC